MEKKTVEAVTVVVFTCALAIPAMTGGLTESSEIGQIQDAMRSLKRVDNLLIYHESNFLEEGEPSTGITEVWADQLTGRWLSREYIVDEDGKRLMQKEYCDGRTVYVSMQGTSEWMMDGGDKTVPEYGQITTFAFRMEDIAGIKSQEDDGMQKILFAFTDQHMEELIQNGQTELDRLYQNYLTAEGEEDTLEMLRVSKEQYSKTEYDDLSISFTIDPQGVLESGKCSLTVSQPEIRKDENGVFYLGDQKKEHFYTYTSVESYNSAHIVDLIDACQKEIEESR